MGIKEVVVRALAHPVARALASPWTRDVATVFMLHRFENRDLGSRGHAPEQLRDALRYLRRHRYDLVPLERIFRRLRGEGPPLRGAVAFTMDDGYVDQNEVGAAIFREFDCPATLFLITGFLDGKILPWPDAIDLVLRSTRRDRLEVLLRSGTRSYSLSTPSERSSAVRDFTAACKGLADAERVEAIEVLARSAEVHVPDRPVAPYLPMSWDDARSLERHEILMGPHTVTHPILSKVDDHRMRREVSGSWARLEEELERPVPVFCYPVGREGDYGDREIGALREMGFLGALAAHAGFVTARPGGVDAEERFAVRRFGFPGNTPDVIQYASWIELAKRAIRGEA
jgi:peptidoglycan/xylan/chitin deacetylase (PgdA/CDA1 family)